MAWCFARLNPCGRWSVAAVLVVELVAALRYLLRVAAIPEAALGPQLCLVACAGVLWGVPITRPGLKYGTALSLLVAAHGLLLRQLR